MEYLQIGIWSGVMMLSVALMVWLVMGMERSGHTPVWIEMIMVVGTYGWWVIVLLESLFGITIEEFGAFEILYIALSPLLMLMIAASTKRKRKESIHTWLISLAAMVYTPGLILLTLISILHLRK